MTVLTMLTRAACAALILGLGACRGAPSGDTNVYESGGVFEDSMIEGNASLAKDLTILEPLSRSGPGDLMEVQFDLRNERSSSLAFQWRIDWFDAGGFRIDAGGAGWEPLRLGGGAQTTLHAIAPRADAQRWRLQVSSPNEVR